MYQYNWGVVSGSNAVFNFYENLKAYVDLPTDNYLMLKFRGLSTGFQRSVICIPSNADFTNPTYDINDRYATFKIQLFNSNLASIGGSNRDTEGWRKTGYVVLTSPEMYEVKYYYRSDYSLRIDSSIVALKEIPELQSVLNLTRSVDSTIPASPAVSYYTEYADNDVISQNISTKGMPTEADDNRDVQYGVQTWTPTY
jgi:hypothetical protein